MKILLVSGIFAMPEEFRSVNLQETTETILYQGLKEKGIDVDSRGHAYVDDWSRYDVVHLSHLANSCVRMFLPQRQKIIFSRHATKHVPLHRAIVLKQTYRRADRVVVSSHMEAKRLEGVVPASRISVIHNGINGGHFPLVARSRPVGDAPWTFLYVGQLIELKRVGLALSLVADLVSAGNNVILNIISQRETLRGELEDQARALGVGSRIRFLGPRDRDALGHEMANAHFLILPSRTEALPTVVTEASHSGLPVIAYRVGGIAEQLPDGYPLPDIEDYAGFAQNTLDQMEGYEASTDRFAAHAKRVRIDFSPGAMVSKHLELYTEVYEKAR